MELAARKLNANFAREVAGLSQMCAHAFAHASTCKREFNATETKFHLSPNVSRLQIYIPSFNVCEPYLTVYKKCSLTFY